MLSDTVYIYTDASFNKAREVAIIGHAIFCSSKEHDNTPVSATNLKIQQINATTVRRYFLRPCKLQKVSAYRRRGQLSGWVF